MDYGRKYQRIWEDGIELDKDIKVELLKHPTDENGNGLTDDSNSNKKWTNPWRFRLDGFNGAEFEEVKEEEKKVNKFKVGDKVRILDGSKIKDYRGGWAMSEFIGEIGIIKKVMLPNEYSSEPSYKIKDLKNNEYDYMFDERGLELVKQSLAKSITITTSDSTTTLTDGTHTVSVNRYYADKHDEEIAVREVTDKYYEELARIKREKNTPKVGNKVRVIDADGTYSRYDDWLIENNIEYKYALLWQENYSPKNESTGFIRAIYPHLKNKDRILALVETESHAYIINIEGLEVVK